jgi:ribosomal protein S18 acetylase RimI-like enzyme
VSSSGSNAMIACTTGCATDEVRATAGSSSGLPLEALAGGVGAVAHGRRDSIAAVRGDLSSGAPPLTERLVVRGAKAEDAGEVAALHIRAWQRAYRGLLPDEHLDALRAEERMARYAFGSSDPDAPQTILALEGGSIRGFATTGASRDADAHGAGELYALYVDPVGWHRGTGRLLLREAQARLRARGFEQALLWVLVGNEQAERFYLADGWRPDGSRRREDVWAVDAEVIRYRRALREP